MPRIRTLKPEALQHRKVGRLSDRAFRLWIAMLTQADDAGRLVADAGHLRLIAFGYFPKVTGKHVETVLQEIAGLGLIQFYEVGGLRYALVPELGRSPEDQPSVALQVAQPIHPEPSGGLQSAPESSGGFPGDRSIDQGSNDRIERIERRRSNGRDGAAACAA